MKKLSIKELHAIYAGARIALCPINETTYQLILCDNQLREITSVTVNPNQDNWQFVASVRLCAKCWGNGNNLNLYKAIGSWMDYPNFCFRVRSIINKKLIERIKDRLI